MAHLFQRVHEQTYIAHVMAYSACIGPFSSCERMTQSNSYISDGCSIKYPSLYVIVILAFSSIYLDTMFDFLKLK